MLGLWWWSAKRLKIKQDQDLCSNSPRKIGFSSSIYQLDQALSYVKNSLSWNTIDFAYYLSYIITKKNFFDVLRHTLPTSQLILLLQKVCSHSMYFENDLLFSFFYLPCQRNKRALSVKVEEHYLEESKNIKASQFSRSFMLWQIPLTDTGSLCRILKVKKLFPLQNYNYN